MDISSSSPQSHLDRFAAAAAAAAQAAQAAASATSDAEAKPADHNGNSAADSKVAPGIFPPGFPPAGAGFPFHPSVLANLMPGGLNLAGLGSPLTPSGDEKRTKTATTPEEDEAEDDIDVKEDSPKDDDTKSVKSDRASLRSTSPANGDSGKSKQDLCFVFEYLNRSTTP